MINRVLDLQHRTVRQIAIPLASALTVTDQTPMREVMTLCREHNVTRLPVWQGEGTQRRMAGILSLRSALYREDFNPELKAAAYLHPSLYLEEDTPLEVAFSRLQRAGERVAIVLDRHRKEIGIVSLQDILKAVFGEVQL
jgi:CBS domain containing-hemolysin-like protein